MVLLIGRIGLWPSSETGAVLWKYPVDDGWGGRGRPEVLSSGEMVIIKRGLSSRGRSCTGRTTCSARTASSEGASGRSPAISTAPVAASISTFTEASCRGCFRIGSAASAGRWALEDLRAIVGHDEEHLFVRIASESEEACESSCYQQLAAVARHDGAISWITDFFASESAYGPFLDLHTDAERVYVFTPIKGNLTTGTLWAFWR